MIIIGHPDGYKIKYNFTLFDALKHGLGELNVPVIYDADIGHIPPHIQIVNGAVGRVCYTDGKAVITQGVVK